jgi:hypothetical protein
MNRLIKSAEDIKTVSNITITLSPTEDSGDSPGENRNEVGVIKPCFFLILSILIIQILSSQILY